MAEIKVGCLCLIRRNSELAVCTGDGLIVEVTAGPLDLVIGLVGWEVCSREPVSCYVWSDNGARRQVFTKVFLAPAANLIPISDPGLDVSDVVESKLPIFNQER